LKSNLPNTVGICKDSISSFGGVGQTFAMFYIACKMRLSTARGFSGIRSRTPPLPCSWTPLVPPPDPCDHPLLNAVYATDYWTTNYAYHDIRTIIINPFLPAKTIFASPVFAMEKIVFFHWLAKTCQPWYVTVHKSILMFRNLGYVVSKCLSFIRASDDDRPATRLVYNISSLKDAAAETVCIRWTRRRLAAFNALVTSPTPLKVNRSFTACVQQE